VDPVGLTKMLADGGPWAVTALCLLALWFMTKKVFAQQATIEKTLKDQSKELIGLLKTVTEVTTKNQGSVDGLNKEVWELKGEVAARGPQLQSVHEDVKRMLREAGLEEKKA